MSKDITAVDDTSQTIDALALGTDVDKSLHPTLDPALPFDTDRRWWAGYDTVPELLKHAAACSGVTYLAGSLYLRFSKRIRCGTVAPDFRRRRMFLALASVMFGTRAGWHSSTSEVSDAIAHVPFYNAPCLSLVYYPWMLRRGEDQDMRRTVEKMRGVYEQMRKRMDMRDVDAEVPNNEGIRSRIARMACSAWSTPETRAMFNAFLWIALNRLDLPVSHRDIQLAAVQLATAAEYEARSNSFGAISSIFYISALMRVFSTHPIVYHRSLWICGLSLLPTLYARIQDYILFFTHCHMEQPLAIAAAQEIAFRKRLPPDGGPTWWQILEDEANAVTLTPDAKPSSGP